MGPGRERKRWDETELGKEIVEQDGMEKAKLGHGTALVLKELDGDRTGCLTEAG